MNTTPPPPVNAPVQRAKIVLLGIAAAVSYGVAHDQLTARLCLEYFTLAHPAIFPVHSLTLLALCWGIASTFLIGAIFGLLLALFAQSAGSPPVPFARLCKGVLVLLAAMAGGAVLAGGTGFELARHGWIAPPAALAGVIPPERHPAFMAVWFVHIASYAVGFLGMGLWLYRFWRERGNPFVLPPLPRSKLGVVRAAVLAALVALIFYVRFLKS